MIIGLSGKMACGKSTLAKLLKVRLAGAKITGFAATLKAELARIYCFPEDWCYSARGKAKTIHFSSGVPKPVNINSMTVRELLQWYGTDYCRAKDPDHWVKALMRDIAGFKNFIILDDIRFPDEADFAKANGICIRLLPHESWAPQNQTHLSETALDDYKGFDYTFHPAFGELKTVADFLVPMIIRRSETCYISGS